MTALEFFYDDSFDDYQPIVEEKKLGESYAEMFNLIMIEIIRNSQIPKEYFN